MKRLIILVCAIIVGIHLEGAIDTSLRLPSFAEIQKNLNAEKQNRVDDGAVSESVTVRFVDEKTVPQFETSGQVSVDFMNQDIKSVLRYISELYDLNIVIPTTLTGNVTLRLKDVTWKALLTAVLSPLNCTYREKDGIIQIGTEESFSREPLLTKTFLLKFADAKTVAAELKDLVDAKNGESLTFNVRTNLLIWTGVGKNLSVIEDVIKKLDKAEAQVMIEAKFVEASNNNGKDFGIKWPGALTGYYNRGVIDQATTTDDSEESSSGDSSSSDDDSNLGKVLTTVNGSKFFGEKGNIVIKTMQANFNFSQTDSVGKTLSNPTIITMNNVPATMSVVKNYPIPNYSYNSDQGSYEISGFEEKAIGIELQVTPKVQAEYITLQLEPSLSDQSGTTEFKAGQGTSVEYPVISQKKTNSTVTIKSGYTIAIGGLMSQTKTDSVTKVPLLGDLPLLGALFSNKTKNDTISNLIIFLSATQIGYDGTVLYPHQVGAKNISDRKMFEMGMTQKDLPGEQPMTDQEKTLYSEIQTLQAKLDAIKLNKKAIKEKGALNKKCGKASDDAVDKKAGKRKFKLKQRKPMAKAMPQKRQIIPQQ